MIALSQLIQVTQEKYFILMMLSCKHDLLRYFTVEKDGSFVPSHVPGVEDEFLEKFSGNSLAIRDVTKIEGRITYRDYEQALFSSCFTNYIHALEEGIRFAEKLN